MSYVYGSGANANYSGRVLVYPNQVPFDTDVLRSDQYRMVDVSMLAQSILGFPATVGGSMTGLASGFCTQVGSPNMTVNIGTCAVYYPTQMETIPYGSIPAIALPLLYKQFINMVAFNSSTLVSGTFVAPSSGNWMYYLIQGTPQEVQINTVSRPYYNPANPPTPNFNSAPDTEIDNIVFSVVAGTPSSKSGALPALPTVSAGAVGMFLILVSDNTTTIVNNLISYFPGSFIQPTLNNVTPVGTIIDFAASTAPAGYLVCDGSAISRATYSSLFSVIGTTWGAGDASTTFNIPNFQNKVTMGAGGSTAIIANTVGSTGGAETYTLAANDLPAHTHALSGVTGQANNGAGPSGSSDVGTVQGSNVTLGNTTTNNPVSLYQPTSVVNKCIKF